MGAKGDTVNESNYKATLKFVRSMAGLAAVVFVAWLVVPKLGAFCHWVGGLDPRILMCLVVAPIVAATLLGAFAIYAVFFKGTNFVKNLVDSETAKMAVQMKIIKVKGGTDEVEVTPGEKKD